MNGVCTGCRCWASSSARVAWSGDVELEPPVDLEVGGSAGGGVDAMTAAGQL